MVVRTWRGRAAAVENADVYARHLRETAFPQLARIAVSAAPSSCAESLDGAVKLLVLTGWDSMESVRLFAGEDPDRAVVEDAALSMLSGYDEVVRHYEVMLASL